MQSGSASTRQNDAGNKIKHVLEFSKHDNHFDVNATSMDQQTSASIKNVVPSEYDYMQGPAPRTVFQQQVPIKVEVERPKERNIPKISTNSTFSIADMYQGLDQPSPRNKKTKAPSTPTLKQSRKKGKSKKERLNTKESMQDQKFNNTSTAASMKNTSATSGENQKNPFWDSLDPKNWVDDAMVKSCHYCQHDFTIFLRRHHCRKCGNIFCNEHCTKRTIQGVYARICTQCLREYELYTQHLQTMMISKQQHRMEQNEEQSINVLPEDYRRFVNESSHIIDDYGNRSMQIPGLKDYMTDAFKSRPLPENLIVKEEKSATARAIGFEPIIDPDSSIMRRDSIVDSQKFQANDQHMDSAPLLNNNLDYMDEKFALRSGDSEGALKSPSQHDQSSASLQLRPMRSEEPMMTAEQLEEQGVSSVARLMEYSRRHIQKVVCEQLFLNDLKAEKWERILTDFVMKAVEQVKPSSRMLGDSMDINEYVKVKIIDWKDNSKSSYINGIVMSKSIASKRMQTTIVNPRILLLRALDQDEARNPNFTIPDLATKIDVEGHADKILEQKLSKIDPNLVIIQKDISVKLMNMMREKRITVVCNLEDGKMKRLARLTQTIVLPSINVIDTSFSLGQCKLFREDNFSRQLRGQDAYFSNTHTVEQTYLVFDGCDQVLGCTICLSGPIQKEGEELIKVKKALKQMITLAKNIVLERHFLTQIQCIVPEPPMDNEDFWEQDVSSCSESTILAQNRPKPHQSTKQVNKGEAVLEDVLNKWEMTDMYSPYLITNYVSNRTRMVYKKIKIALKQRDEPIPSGPTGYEREDMPEDLNDTMTNFIRENTDTPSNRDTFAGAELNKPFVMADGRLKINEKYVQTKLDKMCGVPKDSILSFSRQNITNDSKERNDQTLGKYLEELAETARVKCNECNLEKFQHSQEIYHRDGQIQITIKPQMNQVQTANVEQQAYNIGRGKQPQTMMINTENRDMQDSQLGSVAGSQSNGQGSSYQRGGNQRMNQVTKKKIQIYASCKQCARYCARSLVSSQLYEYSKARFFEQFFYNDKLKVKKGIYSCDHGNHPLRDYIIEFAVDQCKIKFRYTQIDTYSIQIVNPKSYKSKESLRQLVQERKDRLQDVLEKALENFKLDQVGVLKKEINATIKKYDMENQNKFRGSNMSVFVTHFQTILRTLESMQNDFHVFQEEASKELAKFQYEMLNLMFLKRKILMTFLGYQRAIDETIQQLALLIVCARRRAQVIEFQLSQAGPAQDQVGRKGMNASMASQYGIIIDGEEQSVQLQSQTTHTNRETGLFPGVSQQSGAQSIVSGVSMEENVEPAKISGKTATTQNKQMNLSSCAADIVQEEEEKESDDDIQVRSKQGNENGDEMASAGFNNMDDDQSDCSNSDTEIQKIDGSFEHDKQSFGGQTSTGYPKKRRSGALFKLNRQQSFASDVDRSNSHAMLSSSNSEQVMSEYGGKRKKIGSLSSKLRPFGSKQNANGSMASINTQKEPLAIGKRRLQVTQCQEDSMEDEDDEAEKLNDFKKHCFIEELCTCEIFETISSGQSVPLTQSDVKITDTYLSHHGLTHQMSATPGRRISASSHFNGGDFKQMLKQNTMDPEIAKQEAKQMFELPDSEADPFKSSESSKYTATETFQPMVSQSMRQPKHTIEKSTSAENYPGQYSNQDVASPLAAQVSSPGFPMQTSLLSQRNQVGGIRNIRRPITFCHMNGQVSMNKYCGVADHVVPCYQKMMAEVQEMRNLLEKAIYLQQEEQAHALNGLVSTWYNASNEGAQNHKILVFDDPSQQELKKKSEEAKLAQSQNQNESLFLVKSASKPDGFDMIAVEKKGREKESADIDAETMPTELRPRKETNRQGGDLKNDYDFIKVPKMDKRPESPNSLFASKNVAQPNSASKTPQNRESKKVVDPPMEHKWLKIKWIRCLSKKSFPTLPFGVDNIYLNVDPYDLGSIIAYALTSNIYLEGLATLNYMDLKEVQQKQMNKNNNTTYELLDKDDVLNYKHISNKQMENEMLSRNRISFAIKFSTHSKDVSISIKDGRESHNQNHAERYYRTGVTDKRTKKKFTPQDLQSVVSQSDSRTLKGSIKTDNLSKPTNRVKTSKPEMKTKKVFNDFHSKVLPKYPKEYLKQQNITDVINDLEEVQSDLCRNYFSHDQITSINHFVNKRVPAQAAAIQNTKNSPKNPATMDQQAQNLMVYTVDGANANNPIDSSVTNISMAFGGNQSIDQSMQFTGGEQENSIYYNQQMIQEQSIDFNHAELAAMMANQSYNPTSASNASSAFGAPTGFERTQLKAVDKRKIKKFVKEQGKQLHEKEENPMKLEEGCVFGVKSPAQQFIAEQSNSTKFINEELKIDKIDFEVRIFYPKRFSGMRRFYIGTHLDYIMSICKTKTWNSSGGKASMGFFTSHDKKFVFKSVKKEEFEMFQTFAPTYFDYMAKAFFHDFPCCLAKIVGAYEVIISCESNADFNSRTYILVSENLNLGLKKEDEPNIIRFDLKGSENNRLVTPPMGPDGRPERVVLLDNNFLYKMRARPVQLSFEDAQNLHICISNDIDQLQKMNIVDYSLLAVIDTRRKKIRFAILDYCQFFNSKKHIEFYLKSTVNLGGLPTIVPADVYRMRFMTFMTKHFMGVSRQDTKRQSKEKRTTKEQARATIMVNDAEIDKQQKALDEIQAVIREVNQASDKNDQQEFVNNRTNTSYLSISSFNVPQRDISEPISQTQSPLMH